MITYRELRLLEIEILKVLYKSEMGVIQHGIEVYAKIDVDQFYGIEYEEFPAQIAQVALWLMDHQMNMLLSAEFGEYFVRLPLKKSATVVHGNALRIDWESLIPQLGSSPGNEMDTTTFNYIFGNPPFIGSKMMTPEQREDVAILFNNINGCDVLDYVTAWYVKAAKYLQNWDKLYSTARNQNIRVAFVSTNSISQGEQVGLLWQFLIMNFGISINFAHTTFKWSNEAKGVAAV